MEKEKTICFTGHRPDNLPWRNYECGEQFNEFRENLRHVILKNIKEGYTFFISGMAMGFDMIAASVVLELKELYDIKLIAVLPHKNHGKNWNVKEKLKHLNILNRADEVICLSENYTKYCFHVRNKYMVDNSSKVIACYNFVKGGTLNTINYASKLGKEIEYVSF